MLKLMQREWQQKSTENLPNEKMHDVIDVAGLAEEEKGQSQRSPSSPDTSKKQLAVKAQLELELDQDLKP